MMFSLADQPLKGWKILVVDDDQDGAEVAQTLLELYGADVITASNGQDGLALAKQDLPRFIVADLSMQKMSGWAMLHELKQDARTERIPVVALTAHAMTGDRERVLQAGFDGYITKPLRPETFVNDLLNALLTFPELKMLLPDDNGHRGVDHGKHE